MQLPFRSQTLVTSGLAAAQDPAAVKQLGHAQNMWLAALPRPKPRMQECLLLLPHWLHVGLGLRVKGLGFRI